jgi:tetratricopeptide (TPR) repeat protein
MKNKSLVSLLLILFFLNPLFSNTKKKLYLSKINVIQSVPSNIKTSIINRIKLNVLEKYEDKYQIVSDSDVALMNQKAAQLQKQGCSDEVCMKQIAEAIDADEIIYGDVSLEEGKIKFSLTNILRDKNTLQMSAKSIVEVKFSETDYDHYAKEATIKLLEPKYQIKSPTLIFQDKLELKAIDLGKTQSGTLSVLDFKTDDSSVQNVVNFLKEQIREGDELFAQKKYNEAQGKYETVMQKIEEKVLPEKRKKIAKLEESVVERIANSIILAEKEWLDYYDGELKKVSVWKPEDFMWFINNYEGVRDVIDTKGTRFQAKLSTLRAGTTDRIDSLRRSQIVYYEKIADSLYQANEFEKAFDKYETISQIPQYIYDAKKKNEEIAKITKKKDTIRKTGENYVKNAVKVYLDQAEYLNLQDRREDALKSVALARNVIGTTTFVTQASIDYYDKNVKVFGIKTYTEEKRECDPIEYSWTGNNCINAWSDFMGYKNWNDANNACAGIGMRLPTIDELKAAYNSGINNSWKKASIYWSSTPSDTERYYIFVSWGLPGGEDRSHRVGVRCRR